ncbi:MAG: hypothetical protein PHQ62_04220, partial [Clostridia bacterium]|nr:hypothetical protein [Clostridia bacterium]
FRRVLFRSMEKANNSRTYTFWLTILLIIVAIVLFFVIPRTDYNLAFTNVNTTKVNYLLADSNNNTIEYYTNVVYGLADISQTNKDKIINNNLLTQSMFLTNYFVKNSLAFVNHNADYNSNINLQNTAKNVILNQIASIQSYCETTLTEYLKPETVKTSVTNNQIAAIYINQLNSLTIAFANFYDITADIIEKSAINCMEVNPLSIAVNSNFNDCVQRIINQDTISTTTTQSLVNAVNTMYANTYYQNYFTNAVTISNVVSTFNSIA